VRVWTCQSQEFSGEREGLSSEERAELRELRRKMRALEQEAGDRKEPPLLSCGERDTVSCFRLIAVEKTNKAIEVVAVRA